MSETTIGAGLSLGNMTGIDARRIIAERHDMDLNETILLRERLAGWLRAFKALKKDVGIDAAHCPPCLAFDLCDNMDITTHDTGIEDVIDALGNRIDEAENAYPCPSLAP